ncbi:MAG: AbfB domain-containing protein [Treponema sp.]|jgi:hypothetical protein|nr:AbfB domain-containing protein [Treponema sp.]
MAKTDANGITIYGNEADNRCFYERMVELSNGDLLATWMRNFPIASGWTGMRTFYFYSSSDKGKTWKQTSEFDPAAFGFMREKQGMPGLFVLPQTLGDYPAGTILFATTDWNTESEYTIHIFRSNDNGASWDFHSSLAKRGDRNTWEPEFAVSADGRLVCYYSDERQAGYDQCLALEISDNGGKTWGDYKIIVGKETPGWTPGVDPTQWRPGMPRVLRLRNGRYFLVYENIQFEPNGAISWITSPDGIEWGDPTVPGSLVAAGNAGAFQCPEIALLDDGSEQGRLFVRGMNDTCSPSLCFSSIDNGETWELIEAPLTAVRNESVGSGWSGTFLSTGNLLVELNNFFNGNYNEIRCGTGRIYENQIIISMSDYKFVNNASKFCLDDPDGSSTPGIQLIQNGDNGFRTQSWHLDNIADNVYRASCNENDMLLEASVQEGFPVVLNNYTGGTNQQWCMLPQSDSRFKFQNLGNELYMDTKNQSVEEGAGIVCTGLSDKTTQLWNIDRIFKVARYESFNILQRFIRHLDDKSVIIDNDFTTLPLADSQWFIWPGLADMTYTSFESVNYPGYYLRHFEGKVYIAQFTDDYQFKADATFRIRPGLANSDFISLETFNFDGIFMRHRDGILIITEILSDLDKADATFKEIRQ